MNNTVSLIVAVLSFRFLLLIKVTLCIFFDVPIFNVTCNVFSSLQLDIVTSSEGATEIPSLVTRYLRLSDWIRNFLGVEFIERG